MGYPLDVTITDPTGLMELPVNFEEDLFRDPRIAMWCTCGAEFITPATQNSVTRAIAIADRTGRGRDLAAPFNQAFLWADTQVAAGLGGATYLRSGDATKGYVMPSVDLPDGWPAGDWSKIFLVNAANPAAARFLQGAAAGGGGSGHQVQLSTDDRIVAAVGATQRIVTRDPAKWNPIIVAWKASTGEVKVSVDGVGFISSGASASVCGNGMPTFGANTGPATGVTGNWRDIGVAFCDLSAPDHQDLHQVIRKYWTAYGLTMPA